MKYNRRPVGGRKDESNYLPNCNAVNPVGGRYCSNCAAPLNAPPVKKPALPLIWLIIGGLILIIVIGLSGILMLAGLLIFVVGIVGVISGSLPFLNINTKQKAALVMIAGLIVCVIGAFLGENRNKARSPSTPTSSTAPSYTPPPAAKKPDPEIHAAVKFTGTQFIITNNDSYDWTDVKLEINGGLFSGGYQLKHGRIEAGKTYTVGSLQFADSDGKRFNPYQMKPQKFSICGQTPNGLGCYVGGWD